MTNVLVTGGSGFVGSHTILAALTAGHTVRTTVRSLAKAPSVRAILEGAGMPNDAPLTFVEADLTTDENWASAVHGCDYVLHVASPMQASGGGLDAYVRPAVDGTLRVLRASRDAGVKRVVMTSSCGAVYYGHPPQIEPFDEADWTNLEGGEMSDYVRSKAISERAAWDFIAEDGGGLELATVNPTGIFGPVLSRDSVSSVRLVKQLLDGMPGIPNLVFGIVDVRDVADLHLRAMEHPAAAGERFIASSGEPLTFGEVAEVLRRRLGSAASNVPTRRIPDGLVRLAGRFSPSLGELVPLLGAVRRTSNAKARERLKWSPRPPEDALVASAESLIALGVVPTK